MLRNNAMYFTHTCIWSETKGGRGVYDLEGGGGEGGYTRTD
jgi:hypothetical protein